MFATTFIFSTLMLATYGQKACVDYKICSKENSYCGCAGTIHIGVGTSWESREVAVGSKCSHNTMRLDDPAKGYYKYCICDPENKTPNYNLEECAEEGETCECDGGLVFYGVHSTWNQNREMGSALCAKTVFGNIPFGPKKTCVCVKEME